MHFYPAAGPSPVHAGARAALRLVSKPLASTQQQTFFAPPATLRFSREGAGPLATRFRMRRIKREKKKKKKRTTFCFVSTLLPRNRTVRKEIGRIDVEHSPPVWGKPPFFFYATAFYIVTFYEDACIL